MWVVSKDGCILVNSNMVNSFDLVLNEIWADDINIGEFNTTDEGRKEFDLLCNALVSDVKSYRIG